MVEELPPEVPGEGRVELRGEMGLNVERVEAGQGVGKAVAQVPQREHVGRRQVSPSY